jgi:integrase
MDITNLSTNSHKLISHLESNGYERQYVQYFQSEISRILQSADSGEYSNYTEYYRNYEKADCSHAVLRAKSNIISAIEQFDLFGKYPDGSRKKTYFSTNAYSQLCSEYRSLIDCFAEISVKRGKKETSIYNQSHNAATFLLALQQSGVECLSNATEANILAMFVNSNGDFIRHYSARDNIYTVFNTCSPVYPDCKKVIEYLPAFRKKRKNIQYLTAEEVTKIKSVLTDENSELWLRDKAIGIVALYIGLRASDIAALTMTSVDFNSDRIKLCQQKTGEPLILPITAIVGNAIWDYIQQERPVSDCEYIFLSRNRPFGRMSGSGMSDAVDRIMDVAGIRQSPGDRRGLHIFRHNLATTLLRNGVSRPVISSITGQISPKSLEPYLSADFPHLKECSINIEQFPVNQEVFAI